MAQYKNEVEALLFSAGKNLTVEGIAAIIGTDKRQVLEALQELKLDYEKRESSLMIVDEGESWKIHVKEKYLLLVRKIVADTELPKAVLETLAVIAFKSPVLQSSIIETRSSAAYEHIGLLLEMGFITREKKGRSFSLKVTEKFFDYFDVEGGKSLKELFKDIKRPAPVLGAEGQATLTQVSQDAQPAREQAVQEAQTASEQQISKPPEEKAVQQTQPTIKPKKKILELPSSGTQDPERPRMVPDAKPVEEPKKEKEDDAGDEDEDFPDDAGKDDDSDENKGDDGKKLLDRIDEEIESIAKTRKGKDA